MNILTRSMTSKYKNNNVEEEEEDTLIHVENNNIYFYSEINSKNILELRKELKILIDKHQIVSILNGCDLIPIKLHLNSPGGEVKDAFVIIDLIL